jgi:hypothetical protein
MLVEQLRHSNRLAWRSPQFGHVTSSIVCSPSDNSGAAAVPVGAAAAAAGAFGTGG